MSQFIKAEDAAFLLSKLMPLPWLIALARLQGRAAYHFGKSGRVVCDNFKKSFGDRYSSAAIERMSREFFEWERARSLVSSLAPSLSTAKLEQLVPIQGEEHLRLALERGKGVILLGSHLNSAAMFTAIVLLRRGGFEIGVALPDHGQVWDKSLFRRALETLTGRTPTVKEAIGGFYCQFNVRPIVSRLQQNQIVAQTGDGWHSAKFVEVDFLGRKLPFTTGCWSVAQMSGATVVPLFIPGNPLKDMRVVLQKPIELDRADQSGALERTIACYAKDLERYMLEAEQAWMHWIKPDALDAMVEWTRRNLDNRYRIE